MANLAYRLVQRMRDLDLTQEELADRVGVSQTTISKLITGKTERSRYIHDIAEVLQCSAAWLIFGKDSRPNPHQDERASIPQVVPPDAPNLIQIKVYMDVQKKNNRVDWVSAETSHPFPPHFFRDRGLDPTACRLLQVRGDSMAPGIRDGDIVMIDTAQMTIIDGQIYAVLVDGALYLRRLSRQPGSVVLAADHGGAVTLPGDQVTVLGRQVYRAG
jgi:phage repressor protein C with HTH and peptisase S24 domain